MNMGTLSADSARYKMSHRPRNATCVLLGDAERSTKSPGSIRSKLSDSCSEVRTYRYFHESVFAPAGALFVISSAIARNMTPVVVGR